MDLEKAIEQIVKLNEVEVGPTEENVKQKIMVPLLELLGHNRKDLEFEYPGRLGGKIDIIIKSVPPDSKVVIDTKNYNENLDNHIEQIERYVFSEAALIGILANGTEIRIYSPLRGISFNKSLLYLIKRENLSNPTKWNQLANVLSKENLTNRKTINSIQVREQEIRNALYQEEQLTAEYKEKIQGVESDIEAKKEEISQLEIEESTIKKDYEESLKRTWEKLEIPAPELETPLTSYKSTSEQYTQEYSPKARNVTLQELVANNLLKRTEAIYFYHTRLFKEEQAQILPEQNKLKYKSDGKIYSISDLAKKLLIKHGFKRDDHGVAGPLYWKTEDGRLLHELNQQIRKIDHK